MVQATSVAGDTDFALPEESGGLSFSVILFLGLDLEVFFVCRGSSSRFITDLTRVSRGTGIRVGEGALTRGNNVRQTEKLGGIAIQVDQLNECYEAGKQEHIQG